MVDYGFSDNIFDYFFPSSNEDLVSVIARVKELKCVLEEVSKSGIDVTKEMKKIDDIINGSNNKVNISEELKNLINGLEKFRNHYNINNTQKRIEKLIHEVDSSNVDIIVDEIKKLISLIKKPISDDLSESEKVINDSYHLIYKALKIIVLYSDNGRHLITSIFENDRTSQIFISNLVKEDLEKINDNDYLDKMVDEIKKSGFDAINYFNGKLIHNLSALTQPEIVSEIVKDLDNKYSEYLDALAKAIDYDKSLKNFKSIKDSALDAKVDFAFEKIKFSGLCLGLGLVVGLSIYGNIALFNKVSHVRKYNTKVESYDSATGKTIVSDDDDYKVKISDDKIIKISKYSPWVETDKYREYYYERSVSSFYVKNISQDLKLEDYLSLDNSYFTDVNTSTDRTRDYVDNYTEDKYVVERFIQDIDDSKSAFNPLCIPIFLLIDGFIVTIFGTLFYSGFGTLGVDYSWSKKHYKEHLDEYKRNVKYLDETYKNVQRMFQDAISAFTKRYDSLPECVKVQEDIKTKRMNIKDTVKIEKVNDNI